MYDSYFWYDDGLWAIIAKFFLKQTAKKPPKKGALSAIAQDRIVVLGSGTAEVVALLGKDKDIVGVGRTSTYPPSLQENNPLVAYVHRAPAEGILSVKPTHVIGTDSMGPEQTIEVLEKEPSIKLFRTKENENQDDISANIRLIGGFF